MTGHPLDPEDEPGDDETEIMLPDGPVTHVNEVPAPKSAKNRLHLCLRPETSRDAEDERLLKLGVPSRPSGRCHTLRCKLGTAGSCADEGGSAST
jgi:hypothetical protein